MKNNHDNFLVSSDFNSKEINKSPLKRVKRPLSF
ncbi:hypothetical protein GvMRE_Ic2g93 [endosymbiont GvMRE of Glomus versiforme]|nr:hypothetical protein GvMRE_Ic2g93 [endosymbiont GvMRE of Glomus versiforme]